MIEVQGLSKKFGYVQAVDGVSFSVEKGEIVGLLGPNGAGKTTTMRILTCFFPPDSGKAKLAGFDIIENPLKVRQKIGYLPEDTPLYIDLSVESFLGYIADIRGLKAENKRQSVDKMVEVCGLKPVLKMDIGELSKGFRQRVGLAQAMIHNPDILILDEPTTGLDPNQIIEIRKLIKELGKEKTVLLSTHILSEVEATCGRVIIIDRGKVVADGSIEEVTKRAKGANVHRIRIRGEKEKIEAQLAEISGVKGFKFIGEEAGLFQYEIYGERDKELGEDIFRMAVRAGFSLCELYRERKTLEDVFTQLTKGEEK